MTYSVPKTFQLDRELILQPSLEFDEVDLNNPQNLPELQYQERGFGFDELILLAAEKKRNLDLEFSMLEIDFTKRNFLMDLKQRKALQGIDSISSRSR